MHPQVLRLIKVFSSLFITFSFLSSANSEYRVVINDEPFAVGKIYTEALRRKGIEVIHKTLIIRHGRNTIHLSVQEYQWINPNRPMGNKGVHKGILFGHGMISNSTQWVNHIELALRDGLHPRTVIWPGHGVQGEPKEIGAMRSYLTNAQMGDLRPENWIDAVGPALESYMRADFDNYAYWGHSMGDMLASEMNHRGYLTPDFMVLMGGPVSTSELKIIERAAARAARDITRFWRKTPFYAAEDFSLLPPQLAAPKSKKSKSYKIVKQMASFPSPVREALIRRPMSLAPGTLAKDFGDWAMTSAAKGYAWEGNELQTETLFIYGTKEEFPKSSIQDTYPGRGQNIWWSQLELQGANHIGEASPESAKASWEVFMKLYEDGERPKKGHKFTAKTPNSGSAAAIACQSILNGN